MLHQWFTCVHLLDTYLANLTEDFQLSFTTHQFPSEQHKVVCNQHLHAECSGSATISLEVRQKSIKYSQYLTSFCLRTHILLQRYLLFLIDCKVKTLLCLKISTPSGSILRSKPCVNVHNTFRSNIISNKSQK